MALMNLWAAALVTCGVTVAVPVENCLPLDMAPESVDDMYDGCNEKMLQNKDFYLQKELKNKPFSKAWEIARTKEKEKQLTQDELKALYVYTLEEPNIYSDFNAAVRTQKKMYKTSFSYHALHFLLTKAVKDLNPKRSCYNSFRRVNRCFSKDVLNKEFRFGSFTSSSLFNYPKETFGKKSCFKITTCMGAEIKVYSKYKDEDEVLIPPYEVFKVTNIETQKDTKDQLPCDVVYTVTSTTRTQSNLNCALFENLTPDKHG